MIQTRGQELYITRYKITGQKSNYYLKLKHFVIIYFFLIISVTIYAQDNSDTTFFSGSTAKTLNHGYLRINILGKSAYGANNKLEVSTYLTYLIAFRNINFKYKILERQKITLATEFSFSKSRLPFAVADVLPSPIAIIGVASAGLVTIRVQSLKLLTTWQPANRFSTTVRATGFLFEGTLMGGGIVGVIGRANGISAIPVYLASGSLGYIGGL